MMAHDQTLLGPQPPAQSKTLVISESDLATHAGEQTFGVSRYSDDDPDGSRNDLDTMHTFSAAPPDHESIHFDWVDKLTVAMCDKHLGGLVGDGARALRPSLTRASPNHMTITVQTSRGHANHTARWGSPTTTVDSRRGRPWPSRGSWILRSLWMLTTARLIFRNARRTPDPWGMSSLKVRLPQPEHRNASSTRRRVSRQFGGYSRGVY